MAIFAPNSFLSSFHARQPARSWAGSRSGIGWSAAQAIGKPTQSLAAPAPTTYTPPPTVQPPDPAYDQSVGAASRSRDTTLAGLGQQRTQGLQDYGYTANVDQAGNVSGVAFDPTNPFSRAALLRRSYEQSRTGNTNSMAARGQLYAGALVNAQNESTHQFDVGENSLQRALIAFLSQNQAAQNTARTNYEMAAAQAEADRIARAQSNPLNDPAGAAAAAAPVVPSVPVPVPGVRPFNPFVNLNPWRRR